MAKTKQERTGQRQWPKTTSTGFYLGDAEHRDRRLASLEATAKLLHVRGASTIVQIVADVPPEIMAEVLRSLKVYYESIIKDRKTTGHNKADNLPDDAG